jgi:hypothetical protein
VIELSEMKEILLNIIFKEIKVKERRGCTFVEVYSRRMRKIEAKSWQEVYIESIQPTSFVCVKKATDKMKKRTATITITSTSMNTFF